MRAWLPEQQLSGPEPATERDVNLGMAFVSAQEPASSGVTLGRWEQYAQVLLSANEFMFVD